MLPWLLLVSLACGDERSVGVTLEVPFSPGTEVCLSAFGEGELVFAQSYASEEANGSLTFVAGDRIDTRLRVAARSRRGGRAVGWAAAEGPFRAPGDTELLLRVARCSATAEMPPATVLGLVADATSLVAGDLDGDGIDEVLANTDAVEIVGGEPIALSGGARAVSVGDLDGDCVADLVASAPTGIVRLPEGTPLSAAGVFATLADAGEGRSLVSSDDAGLRIGPLDGVMRSLTGNAIDDLAIADLDADGTDDIIAVGLAGVEAFFGGEGGPTPAPGATPTDWAGTAVALGDFDGDGRDDIAVAGDTEVFVGRNRGDGLMEARASLPLEGDRLRVVDVDRDCADDLVVVGAASQIFFGAADAVLRAGPMLEPILDATVADVDGDGVRELVLLTASGEVKTWAP